METHPRYVRVDMTSRVLAILSLIVAACSLAFYYTHYRQTATRDELLAQFNTRLTEEATKFQQARDDALDKLQATIAADTERMEGWNTTLNQAVADFRTESGRLLAELEEAEKLASQQRQETFRTALAEQAKSTSNNADTAADSAADALAAPKNQVDVADTRPEITDSAASDLPDTLQDRAKLTVVTSVLRPGTGETTLVTIKNNGQQEAEISRVRFLPTTTFTATDNPELAPGTETSSVTTLRFDPSENMSSKSGKHGVYDRKLQQPIRVPAGESITMRLLIHDPQYKGFGFVGQLQVEYNGGEPLSVDSARVAFSG